MIFRKPDCNSCIHANICGIKLDAEMFVEDMEKTKFLNNETYAEKVSDLAIEVKCKHFLSKKDQRIKSGG